MEKKRLLLIIDNLKKGGAEIMLAGILPNLTRQFEVILVTLSEECAFREGEIICHHRYSLGFTNRLRLAGALIRLKKLIRKHRPHLIHSHLIYSSLLARLACPARIPLLYSIHGELSKSDFNNSKMLTFLEKFSIRNNHALMAVSETVLEDYKKTIGSPSKKFVLHNYIRDQFFSYSPEPGIFMQRNPLRMIAVGNIKVAKNYGYLLKAFGGLKGLPVILDIYGNTGHPLFKDLLEERDRTAVAVNFNGAAEDIHQIMKNYDVFIMSSSNEGFGIAVIEAMATGLPVLVSDIPVMREITGGTALFFDLQQPESLITLIKDTLAGKHDLAHFARQGRRISEQYSKKIYVEKLLSIYYNLIDK